MMNSATKRVASSALAKTQQLWKPSMGIKFSPVLGPQLPSLYPALDFRRFFHSPETATSTQDDTLEAESVMRQPHVTETVAFSRGPSSLFSSVLPAADLEAVNGETPGADSVCAELTAAAAAAAAEAVPNEAAAVKPEFSSSEEPPYTSLDFQMSKDLFHRALEQPQDSDGSFWSHTMYSRTAADGTTQGVAVHYCTTVQDTERICREHFVGQPVLGFDLEWLMYSRPGGGAHANVSLIQLASPSCIGLFHVALFPDSRVSGADAAGRLVAPTFRAIMEDEHVRKAGVNILGDTRRLSNYLGIKTRGVSELSHLYKLIKYANHKQRRKLVNRVVVSMEKQAQEYLKLPIYKGDVRVGNWATRLNSKQIEYSASDAYAGLQLFHIMEEKRLAMDPQPEHPPPAELGLPIPVPPLPSASSAKSQLSHESEIESTLVELETSRSEGLLEDGAAVQTTTVTTVKKSTVPSWIIYNRTRKSTSATSKASKSKANPSSPPVDARVLAAGAKAAEHRTSRAAAEQESGRLGLQSSRAALRAFFLWHDNVDLSPADVAGLLRDPPLQLNTVVSYILDALTAETTLDFSPDRLRREVIALLHPKLASGRYAAVVKRCAAT